jgi:type I restriction enzyme M protein
MPMGPAMRRGVDQIRDYLYGGGYLDPMGNAEQLSFLFFFYLMEAIDRDNQLRAEAAGRAFESIFSGGWKVRNPLNAPAEGVQTVPKAQLRWSEWARGRAGEELVRFVRDEVFPFSLLRRGRRALGRELHGRRPARHR